MATKKKIPYKFDPNKKIKFHCDHKKDSVLWGFYGMELPKKEFLKKKRKLEVMKIGECGTCGIPWYMSYLKCSKTPLLKKLVRGKEEIDLWQLD